MLAPGSIGSNDARPAAGSPELRAVRGRSEKRNVNNKVTLDMSRVTFICNLPFLNFSETVGGRPQLPTRRTVEHRAAGVLEPRPGVASLVDACADALAEAEKRTHTYTHTP